MRRSSIIIPLLVLGSLCFTWTLAQQSESPGAGAGADVGSRDPVKLAPEVYKVTLDDDRVRVLDITLRSGGKSPMHSHPAYVIYVLSDGKARFTAPDGTTTERELKAGETRFIEAESHAVENIGGTDLRVLNIELKQPSAVAAAAGQEQAQPAAAHVHKHVVVTPDKMNWTDGPAGLPTGGQMMLLEGDPAKPGPFAVRFKAPAGFKIPPHWHPADEHLTIISGTMQLGDGDTFNRERATKLPAGSYTVMPAKMHHFAFFDEETVIQLHGVGPWAINYINPSDDPRKTASPAQR